MNLASQTVMGRLYGCMEIGDPGAAEAEAGAGSLEGRNGGAVRRRSPDDPPVGQIGPLDRDLSGEPAECSARLWLYPATACEAMASPAAQALLQQLRAGSCRVDPRRGWDGRPLGLGLLNRLPKRVRSLPLRMAVPVDHLRVL